VTVRVAVLDYQAGNVRSAKRGFDAAGGDAFITDDPASAGAADALVIPGVGHFASCLANLTAAGLVDLVRDWIDRERPVFGICVGMQLLYEHSAEGDTPGLGLLPGSVERFSSDAVVPHMGWDVVTPAAGRGSDPLLAGVVLLRAPCTRPSTSRTAAPSGSPRAAADEETVYDVPTRSPPRSASPTPGPSGSTSSTSTPRSPASRATAT
jgi:glutamine amidotransferase PdxT